jgi:hypothetical protein
VRGEDDDHKENIGMLINLFQLRSIYFNQEISRSYAIRNSDIQCNNFSKLEALKRLVCSYVSELKSLMIGCAQIGL